MFEVTAPFHREIIYRVWCCLESKNHPGASSVNDETTGVGVDTVGHYADSCFVGGDCPPLEVHPGEVLVAPRRDGGFPVILVSSAVQNWLEQYGNNDGILGVW
ncbi:gp95 [Corynebacterium phage P1201]|uniref:Gp95 n=1 Tax=Corynebacterium phage P1201 TaxID=384848 RepID=A7IYG2_9CAUD|nr:gp95 [Corynebacterium phage P1201]ABF57545.1 gp95 [Corynebacterium phage P1201]